MPRLIDVDAFKIEFCEKCNNVSCDAPLTNTDCFTMYMLDNAPTVEAEPARHGKWIEWNGMDIPENHGRHKCSICGEFAIKPKYGEEILTKRCNNCDAKMDGD